MSSSSVAMQGGGGGVPVPDVSKRYPPFDPDLDIKAGESFKRGHGPVPAEEWICGNRAAHDDGELVYNQPIKNYLLTLPPITCTGCGKLNPAGYVWSIIECTINDIELDFVIRDQGKFDTCVAHAILAAMDLMRRIDGAVTHGAMVCQPLDMYDIFRKFKARFGVAYTYESDQAWHLRQLWIECILNIVQADGVGYEAPTYAVPRDPSTRVLRIGEAFDVPAGNKYFLARLIAGGHPLVATVPTGRTFRYVAAGQIYDGVTLEKNHAVALIGFGVAHWPGNPTADNEAALKNWPMHPGETERGPRLFFRARGSYNERSHPHHARVNQGGDFDIWAEDLQGTVWGFDLPSGQ